MATDAYKTVRVEADGKTYFLCFDLKTHSVCDDITDYCIHLVQTVEADAKTVEMATYHVKRFFEYLYIRKIDLRADQDRYKDGKLVSRAFTGLTDFRDYEYQKVLNNPKGRGNKRTAMETVNARMTFVGAWLLWMRVRGRVPRSAIGGSGSKVVIQAIGSIDLTSASRQASIGVVGLFRRTGKASKHKRAFVPDDEDLLNAKRAVHSRATTPFQAHRDSLILDIANTMGLRRGSIASLRVDQFLAPPLREAEFVDLIPAKQKFGYTDSYPFPVPLYERVRAFCRDYLADEARRRGWPKSQMEGRIFLSSRDGKPLKERSITHLVRNYLRAAASAPPGASLHSFRHKFFNDEIEKETIYRVRAGLDTSAQSIASAVSLKGGHRSPDSLTPYVSHYLSSARMRRKIEALNLMSRAQ